MFAFKALAMFTTIMFSLLVVPLLFALLFGEFMPPFAMNLMPILWIGSFFVGIYLAVQIGKAQG